MKARRFKKKYFTMAIGIVIALVSIVLLGIYGTAASSQEHLETLRLFGQLRETEQDINESILRARGSTLVSYDHLVSNSNDMGKLCETLIGSLKAASAREAVEYREAAQAFCSSMNKKLMAIEVFKTKNSVARNSLHFLRSLIGRIASPRHQKEAQEILFELFSFNTMPSEFQRIRVQSQIAKFKQLSSSDKNVKSFQMHSEIAFSSIQGLKPIEAEIFSHEIDQRWSKVRIGYLNWFELDKRRAVGFHVLLVIICASLGIVLALLFERLNHTTEKIAELNLELEDKVIRRTAELEDALNRLSDQQQMSVQVAKMSALGEMAGGVAHEINTPLGAIMLNAELLAVQLKDDPDKLESAESIIDIVNRISKIIHGLKRFARNDVNDEMQKAFARNIVTDTLNLCRERFKSHGITIHVADFDDSYGFRCRPEQISQVLLNLLNNSFDAIEDTKDLSEKVVSIDVVATNSSIQLRVSDSGPGIPKSIRDKIMQPFFTTKAIGKGTGLGLSISRGIIAEHGGHLFLDDKQVKTTIVIELPRLKNDLLAAA